ncbi:MAG TPA: MOFRL family protein [Candidatus Paceibacterota bacterium]|nr:MOFRL family protein [Candidatus Paceibacterota bacterium]
MADSDTLAHASAQGLSAEWYLASHKSYDFFTASGDYLLTGPTGSNVSDLVLALKR